MIHITKTTVLFLVIVLMFIPQWTTAQTINHPLLSHGLWKDVEEQRIEKGTDLEEALSILEATFGVLFLYRSQLLDQKKIPDVEVIHQNRELGDILQSLLNGSDLTYKQISHRTIGIAPEHKVEESIDIYQETVTGTVIDAQTGEALPGVNIIVQGTDTGTTTDVDGVFELNLPSLNEILVFSYIGYQSQEVSIDGRTEIDVSLFTADIVGEELVVIGYGEQRRSDLTGSITSISARDLEGQSISSIDQGLQGKAAGVNVTSSSGRPGGEMIVRIRGNNSIIGSNDPLYVVDGVPVRTGTSGGTSMMAMLDPGNIESIDILKDASATAIYGSRGSNGVIIITTKQGLSGANMIDFQTSVGYQEVENKIDMMNSRQMLEVMNERAVNDGQNPFFSVSEVESLSQINTDWQNEIFRIAPTQNYTLSFSGGDETTRYVATGNIYDQEGIIQSSNFMRGSIRLNLDQEINPRLNISTRTFLSRSTTNAIPQAQLIESTLQTPPWLTIYDDEGNYTSAPTLKQYPFSPSSGENPVALAKEQLNKRTMDRILGNVAADYNFHDNIIFRMQLGVDHHSAEQNNYNPRILDIGLPAGSGSRSFSNNTSFLFENTLNYQSEFRENDRINITAGVTWEQDQNRFLSGSASDFVTDDLQSNNLSAGESFSAPNTSSSESTLLSGLARINYAMNDRYLFTVAGRIDGSSRFGAGNKWGFFPSGAFSWILSEEDFISQNFQEISELKVRISYGISGNQAISPYESLQRFSATSLSFGGSPTTGFFPANLGNPELRWETTEEVNIGLEIGLWDQRLRVSSDYYVKNTSDLLALVNLPPNTGFNTTLQNIGSTRNRGLEFDVDASIFRGDITWNVGFNVAANRNVVTETAGGQDIIVPTVDILGSANIIREGEPLGAFFGLELDDPPLTEDGYYNFVDQNGDGIISDSDRVILGSPYPDFVYGFNTQVNYRNFQLNVSIQGEYGRQIYNSNKYRFMSSSSRGQNSIAEVYDKRWSPENPDRYAPYPRSTSTLNHNPSDWMIEDGSYLRLQNVRLSYNLPRDLLDSIGLRNASLTLSGQNLLTITGYSWYTPDVNTFGSGDLRIGVDHRSYPSARTIEFGVGIGL